MANHEIRFKKNDGTEYADRKKIQLSDVASYNTVTSLGFKSTYVGTENMLKGCCGVEFDGSDETVKGIAYQKGDILVSNIRPYLEKAWLADRDGVCSTDVLCVRPKADVNSEFLYFVIGRGRFFAYMMKAAKGSKMPRGDKEFTMSFPISFPTDSEEQQKITALFTELDNLISATSDEISTLEEAKRGMIQKIFSQKVRFKKDDGTVFDDWRKGCIGDYYVFKNGLNKEKSAFGKGTPIINYTDVYKNRILTSSMIKGKVTLSSKEIDNYRVRRGDVFFTRTSETIEEIGFTAALVEEIPDCVFSGFILRARPIDNTVILPEFAGYYFMTSGIRREIRRKSTITTRALTSGTNLSSVKVKIPCIEEQRKIADFFISMDDTIAAAKEELEGFKQLKKYLLQSMFA